jgi:hypothetical protein
MISLIEYFTGIMIVILFLVGAALLALRWRIREERDHHPEETALLEEIDDQPKRRFPRPLRGEYTRVL